MASLLLLPLVLAQVTGGRTIIEDSINQVESVQTAWDERWTDIFDGTNGLYNGINEFASLIVVGAFLFFAVGWVKEAIERGIFPALPNVLWMLVIFVLLFNNGAMLGSITLGIRNLINDQTRVVLDVQIGEVSMLEALNDVIVSQQAKAVIQQQYTECEAKEGQAQIDCFLEAGERAEQIIDREYRARGWVTAGVERLLARVRAITQQVTESAANGNIADQLGWLTNLARENLIATAGQSLAQQVLKGFQWAFANLIELAMLLTGLMGPIAVAGSVIPLRGGCCGLGWWDFFRRRRLSHSQSRCRSRIQGLSHSSVQRQPGMAEMGFCSLSPVSELSDGVHFWELRLLCRIRHCLCHTGQQPPTAFARTGYAVAVRCL
jgi:hypothetical protein